MGANYIIVVEVTACNKNVAQRVYFSAMYNCGDILRVYWERLQ